MKTAIKRLIALILAMAMSLSLLCANTWAASLELQEDSPQASVASQEDTEASSSEEELEKSAETEEQPPDEEEASTQAEEPEDAVDESKIGEPSAQELEVEEETTPAEEVIPKAEEKEPEKEPEKELEEEPDQSSQLTPLSDEQGDDEKIKSALKLVRSVEVEGITRFVKDRFVAEDEGQAWHKLDCYPESITVTMTNGTVFNQPENDENGVDFDALQNELLQFFASQGLEFEGVPLYWDSDEQKNNPWGAGEHTARIMLFDEVQTQYDVKVIDIGRIDVEDVVRYEGNRIHDEGGDLDGLIDCRPDQVSVTLSDGNTVSSEEEKNICEQLMDAYPGLRVGEWGWKTTEKAESPWVAQEAPYEATFFLDMPQKEDLGNEASYTQSYNVYVRSGRLASVVVLEEVQRLSSDRLDCYDEEKDEHWEKLDCWPERIRVTLRDEDEREQMFSLEGDPDEVENQLREQGMNVDFWWDSDETKDAPWSEGKHSASCGFYDHEADASIETTYTVQVVNINAVVEGVQVDDITRLETDRFDTEWYVEESDSQIHWRKLDCGPEKTKITLDGGTVLEGDDLDELGDRLREHLSKTYPNIRVNLYWDSDEEPVREGKEPYTGSWVTGQHTATVRIGSAVWNYRVNVIESVINSVSAEDMEVYESYFDNDWYWDEGEDKDVQWQRLDCYPERITVQTSQGEFSGDSGQVLRQLREQYPDVRLNLDWHSQQDEDHREIKAGDSFQAWYTVGGVKSAPYTVTVKASPIASIEVADMVRFNTDKETVDWEEREPWERIDCWPERITVHMRDGAVYPAREEDDGDPWAVRDWIERNYDGFDAGRYDGIWWDSAQSPENVWNLGRHEGEDGAQFHFGGKTVNYAVTVVEAPSVEISDIRELYRLSSDRHNNWDWDEESEQNYEWERLDCWPEELSVRINGKAYQGDLDEIEKQLRQDHPDWHVECNWESDEKAVWNEEEHAWQGQWESGEHTAWVEILGARKEYTVHVLDIHDLVKSVETDDIHTTVKDRALADWYDEEEERSYDFLRVDCEPRNVKITMKDKDSTLIQEENFYEAGDRLRDYLSEQYHGIRLEFYWFSDEKPLKEGKEPYDGNWRTGEHQATLYIGGYEQQYTVTVMDSPIQSVSVGDIVRFDTDREQTWDDEGQLDWQAIQTWPDSEITVKLMDGGEVTGILYASDESEERLENKLRAALQTYQDGEYKDLNIRLNHHTNESYAKTDEGYVGTWKAGDVGTASLGVNGVWTEYKVRVIENPVERVDIADQTIPSSKRIEWEGAQYLDCAPEAGEMKVWLKGESEPITGVWKYEAADSIEKKLDDKLNLSTRRFVFDWWSEETPESPWSHGAYIANLVVFGKHFPYTVNVTNDTHTLKAVQAKSATCTEDGNIAYWSCSECKKLFSDAEGKAETTQTATVISAKGHSWDNGTVTKAATCKAKGEKTFTCTNCDQVRTEELGIDGGNHAGGTERRNSKAATCGTDGYTGDTYCLSCGEKLSGGQITRATGNHTWDSGTVTTQPTTTTEGVKTYKCTVCGQTRTESVAKLPQPQPEPVVKVANTIKGKDLIFRTYNAKKVQSFSLGVSANGAPLSYKSSNKKVTLKNGKVTVKKGFMGQVTITVTAAETESYLSAQKKITLMVGPSATKLSSVKYDAKKKVINAAWKKNTTCKGYEIQVSLKKDFKKVAKKVKINKNVTVKTAIKGLKKGTYYVRIRTINGKAYSDWSKTKTVNITK